MTETTRLANTILSLPGVHTLYPADPAWKTTARRVRAAFDPKHAAGPDYVQLSTEGTTTALSVRVGADGTVPAAELARTIAATLRSELKTARPGGRINVTVEISSIQYTPSPAGTPPTS